MTMSHTATNSSPGVAAGAGGEPTWTSAAALAGRADLRGGVRDCGVLQVRRHGRDRRLYRSGGVPVPALPRLVRGDLRGAFDRGLPLRRVLPRDGARCGSLRALPRLFVPRAGALAGRPGAVRVRLLRRPFHLHRRALLRRGVRAREMGDADRVDRPRQDDRQACPTSGRSRARTSSFPSPQPSPARGEGACGVGGGVVGSRRWRSSKASGRASFSPSGRSPSTGTASSSGRRRGRAAPSGAFCGATSSRCMSSRA